MDHIFCEIEIFLCEGAAYIILIELPIAALFNEPLVFRHDGTIATAAVHTEAKRIINLFAPINRENDIGHFTVDVIDFVICQQQAGGGDREAEIFVMLLFDRTGLCHHLLNDLKIHQRLTAKEIQLQIMAVC